MAPISGHSQAALSNPNTFSPGNVSASDLWFDTNAEEAVDFYLTVFKNPRRLDEVRNAGEGPGPKGRTAFLCGTSGMPRLTRPTIVISCWGRKQTGTRCAATLTASPTSSIRRQRQGTPSLCARGLPNGLKRKWHGAVRLEVNLFSLRSVLYRPPVPGAADGPLHRRKTT